MTTAERLRRFERLYQQHFRLIWSVVGRAGMRSVDREDVAQEVWLTVHRRLHTLQPEASTRAWLCAIARRVAFRHRRTAMRADRRLAALAREPDSNVEWFDPDRRHVTVTAIGEALASLSDAQRRVLVLVQLHGFGDDPDTAAVADEGGANESSSSTSGLGGSTYAETGTTGNGSGPGADATSNGGSDSSTAGWDVEDCSNDGAPEVMVTMEPSAAPNERLLYFLNCSITARNGASPDPVSFTLDCVDGSGDPHGTVALSIDASRIVVPAVLQPGVEVETRLYSWRGEPGVEPGPDPQTGTTGFVDIPHDGAANYFVLLQDGEIILAAGNGSEWPEYETTKDDFNAPLNFSMKTLACLGEPTECAEPTRGQLKVYADGDGLVLNDFSSGLVSDYAVHTGSLMSSDYYLCENGERSRWLSYAIARQ